MLLERNDDNSALGVTADLIYNGILNNDNEALSFYNSNCELIDQVKAEPDWPAGDLGSKKSMERGINLTWHTYCGESGYVHLEKKILQNCPVPSTTTTTTTIPLEPGSDMTPYPSLEWNWYAQNDKRPYLKIKKSELLAPVDAQEVKAVVFYLNQNVPNGGEYDYISWSKPQEWSVLKGDNQKALILVYSGPYSLTSSTALLLKTLQLTSLTLIIVEITKTIIKKIFG